MDNIINFSDKVKEKLEVKDNSLQERRKEAISKLPRFRGEVPSKTTIRGLREVTPGEIFWVTGDGKAYIVAAKEGKKITIKALDETATLSTGITIYDFNKGIISKEPIFDFEDTEAVEALTTRFRQFFEKDCNDTFYLLYGRDIHYLSLFKDENGVEQDINEVFVAIKNIGALISVDFNNSDGEVSAEVWVRTADSSAELLYLFPFDKGIIQL